MEDKRKNNGGHKTAGRKSKADEQKVNTLFINALKELYNEDNEDTAKVNFIKTTLMDSQRGQLFIAEHIFGKPKDVSEVDLNVNEFSIKDIFKVDRGSNK
jgi:hypothetical protein